MSNPTLVAQTRSEFGKGAARRARRAGLVPGVLYGHGGEPVHVDLPAHELFLAVRGQKNALLELVIEGKKQLALVKEVQRHPVSRDLLHADFLAVKAGEVVDVEVPVSIIGESAAGTQHTQEEFALLVKAPATAIPESIEVDITGIEAGTAVRVADVTFPEGLSPSSIPRPSLSRSPKRSSRSRKRKHPPRLLKNLLSDLTSLQGGLLFGKPPFLLH